MFYFQYFHALKFNQNNLQTNEHHLLKIKTTNHTCIVIQIKTKLQTDVLTYDNKQRYQNKNISIQIPTITQQNNCSQLVKPKNYNSRHPKKGPVLFIPIHPCINYSSSSLSPSPSFLCSVYRSRLPHSGRSGAARAKEKGTGKERESNGSRFSSARLARVKILSTPPRSAARSVPTRRLPAPGFRL